MNIFSNITDNAHTRLLFDPQTGGGLLAAVPADQAPELLQNLHDSGHPHSAVIGHLHGGLVGQIDIA